MKKSNSKTVIVVLLFALMSFAIVGLGVKVFSQDKTNTVNTAFGYTIGAVEDSTGKVVESKKNIVMKDIQKVENMEIEVADNATVTYKVYFYDTDKAYLSCTNVLNSNFDKTTIPEKAKYFRVVITPGQVDGEDVVVTSRSVEKYAKQLKVVFGK